MEQPKVSVIIPVYNTEAYLEEAVRCIMAQTLRELEIIIVNDGSTDGSPAILERLAAEDPRIVLFTQANAGLAATRNAGLQHIRGKYVYFMDSDDRLEADALELCYDKCEQQQLDFVLFDAEVFGYDGPLGAWFDYHRAALLEDRVYRGTEAFDLLLKSGHYRASVCLNLIRVGLLRQCGLQFQSGILHEDELFTALLYWQAERVGRIDRAFFKRRLREQSIMTTTFSERNMAGYLRVAAGLRAFAADKDVECYLRAERMLRYTLNPTVRNAWALPAAVRLKTFGELVRRYPGVVRPKNLAILLLKAPLKKLAGGAGTGSKKRHDEDRDKKGGERNPENSAEHRPQTPSPKPDDR